MSARNVSILKAWATLYPPSNEDGLGMRRSNVRKEAEAGNNQKLADLTIKVLTSIENLTDDTQVLPVRGDRVALRRSSVKQ